LRDDLRCEHAKSVFALRSDKMAGAGFRKVRSSQGRHLRAVVARGTSFANRRQFITTSKVDLCDNSITNRGVSISELIMAEDAAELNVIELAAELTIAWLGNANTRVSADDVPAFLKSMHGALTGLAVPGAEQAAPASSEHVPAVTVRKSLASSDHLISLIDGKPYKTLRRHLSTNGLTPEEYRARYNLKPDYPMVAPAYSEARRAMAKKIGLGRKPGQGVKAAAAAKAPRRRAKEAR
jgi:predicted transcriptional regulator